MSSAVPPAPFIVGAARSGTTLLRMMLDAHPALAIPPETHFIAHLKALWRRRPPVGETVDALVHHPRWPDFGIDAADFRARVESAGADTPTEVFRVFYATYAKRHGKPRWGDKTPNYVLAMPVIAELLPEARFIHVIRDGRDVALSVRPLWFGPTTIEDAALWWKDWVEAGRRAGGRLHYLEVKYEQFVQDARPELKRVCRFIDLDLRDEMLASHLRASERLSEEKELFGVEPELRRKIHAGVTGPPDSRRIGRWRTEMTSDELRRFELLAGDTLEEMGYPLAGRRRSSARAVKRVPVTVPLVSPVRHLLVTGTRAAVFDVGMLLNEHPLVLMGIERFSAFDRRVDPFLLNPGQLITPLSAETRVRGELLYERLGERVGSDGLALTGDVDPAYVGVLRESGIPAHVWRIVVVIDEASEPPLDHWRAAVGMCRESERLWFRRRLLVVPYRAFSTGSAAWLEALLAFAELPHTDRVDDAYARLRSSAEPLEPTAAALTRAPELLQWLHARGAQELERYGGRPAMPRLPDPPLTEPELASRAREREQLLNECRRGSEWSDERRAVRARYGLQARVSAARIARIVELGLTAAPGLPSAQSRVAVVAPQPRPHELGRLDSVERLAGHLARLCNVRLVTAASLPGGSPPGVEERVASTLTSEVVGDCDAVIVPAELADPMRLVGEDRAILWLDGFALPDTPEVLANLESARLVLGASRWLCDLARMRGAPAIHLPLGLDRELFTPGPPNQERGLHVTGIAQTPGYLGCAELSEAMIRVRERRPEVEVTLIGGVPADGATKFLRHPRMTALAEALRSSAVHVTSAQKEGFNFTGAVALASGAALVSTDTQGSHDFAVHGRTALLSPVGDPEAMAEHVLALLQEPGRRARLAREGSHQVRLLMRPWMEVARELALIVAERT